MKAKVATVHQFPLILSFASTTHKIQGQTIIAPRKAAVDLKSVFGANQSYVMLGRVQKLEQLFLIGSLAEGKIYANQGAKNQLAVLKARSVNKNPSVWEKSHKQSIKISCLNISSLRDKIDDLRADHILLKSDVIILPETWLNSEVCEDDISLQIEGYELYLNSVGRGRGIAAYVRRGEISETVNITQHDLQIIRINMSAMTVIALYRSQADRTLAERLAEELSDKNEPFLVIGDFNLCSRSLPNHEVFNVLTRLEFRFE